MVTFAHCDAYFRIKIMKLSSLLKCFVCLLGLFNVSIALRCYTNAAGQEKQITDCSSLPIQSPACLIKGDSATNYQRSCINSQTQGCTGTGPEKQCFCKTDLCNLSNGATEYKISNTVTTIAIVFSLMSLV